MRQNVYILFLFMAPLCSSQSVMEEILQRNRAMEKAYNSGETAKIAQYYTGDAVIVGNGTEVKGGEAVTAYWENLRGRHIKWEMEDVEIIDYGEVVVQRGISRLQFYYQDKPFQSDVRFTLIWVKENGEWKIKLDHYSKM